LTNVLQHIVLGVFVAILAVIVFVRAGQKGGATGGQQSAQIISAAGSAFSSGVQALEG